LSATRLPFRHPGNAEKSSGLAEQRAKVVRMLDGLKVVVAEDEGLIRMDIVATLEEAGLVVVGQAADGEEAIALATEHEPDLVVMDVKMPKLDGISAAEKISALKIPVVLLTAFSDSELVARAAEAGAMAYVTKPFKPTDLLPAIQIALSRHEELVSLEGEIADLSERLETRKLMDRAKGLLQSKMKLSEPEAFRWIQKASMDRRLTMAQVAKAVIEQLGDKDPKASAASS
jgi:two-component system, response regulator PdtaR